MHCGFLFISRDYFCHLCTINYAIIFTFKDRLPNYFKKIYLFIILISYKVIRLIYAHTV